MKPSAALRLLALAHTASSADNFDNDYDARPTAIRKLAPGSNGKILAHHLAFAPIPVFLTNTSSTSSTRFFPPYARHFSSSDKTLLLRRAAHALALLQRRDSCPSGTASCADIDHPNKCCQDGTYCVSVDDDSVGGVACCPDEAECNGVGDCPTGSTSCSEDVGGGCCVAGYVCEGVGCVPSASATKTSTATETATSEAATTTAKATATTTTSTSKETTTTEETTRTTTSQTSITSTTTITGTATGGAPLRPISSSSEESTTATTSASTQTGCPTNYYGCLATHGGGCCRTDRSCNTYDCPASSTTTVLSDGATVVVVAATDAPPASAEATSTCADGWFLCGTAAGTVAGCCPSGYGCGTASCYTVTASHTESVQKEFPDAVKDDGAAVAARDVPRVVLGTLVAAVCLVLGM